MVLFHAKMSVSISTWGWLGLALILFMSSFGLMGFFWLFLYVIAFIAGFLVMLFLHGKARHRTWVQESHNMVMAPPSVGIPKLVEDLKKEKSKYRMDKRMTGSVFIDEVLQEILDYTYRDYIHTWYRKISDDEQFGYDIRQTLQRVIIAFSERAKEVDLVPYITTRLVDDFASHIRLYRTAMQQLKEHQKDDTKPPADLESIFFDLETEMENNMCRDMICTSEDSERQYLQDLSEVLLFLLLPPGDFHNKPFRYIAREVFVNGIFHKAVGMVSDPDYINQKISWLCKEASFNNETFLTAIKTSDNVEELLAVREKVDIDIARQRSKDTGGDDDTLIKQQLSSLIYVKALCESRIQRLNSGVDEPDAGLIGNLELKPGQKLYNLPFDVVLHNNVALSYFIEFMTGIGAQAYLFFYLTVECYRTSAEQLISASLLAESTTDKPDLESLRDSAIRIFNQYLSEKACPRLKVDERTIYNLWEQIQNRDPGDTLFNDIQARVCDYLQEHPKYFPAFRKSQMYIKLLAELDLLCTKEGSPKLEDGLVPEEDTVSTSSKSSSLQARLSSLTERWNIFESVEDLASSCDSISSSDMGLTPKPPPTNLTFTLSATIGNTGVCREHGKAYAVYLITVTKHYSDSTSDVWDVYRRYSDFHDFHMILQERYEVIPGLALPSKKVMNHMSKEFVEKRRIGLDAYLKTLLSPSLLNTHRGLFDLVFTFLEAIHWEREKSQLQRKMDTIVNPLKNSVRNVGNIVKSMPDNFADGVAKMSGGFKSLPNNMLDNVGKILNVKGPPGVAGSQPPQLKPEMFDIGKVGASLAVERDEDNIPMRIMLLLMDEVFDLRNRNQVFRSRIAAILRMFVKTMFGDSINRKIIDNVEWMTSSEQLAEYLKNFREAFWPNGTLAEPHPPRDLSVTMRTRVVCKSKMLGSVSDDIRRLVGTETSRQGVMRVFNLFQHPTLNKRLVYVILEGMLETLFPDHKFPEVFRTIHSRSARVKQEKGRADRNGGATVTDGHYGLNKRK